MDFRIYYLIEDGIPQVLAEQLNGIHLFRLDDQLKDHLLVDIAIANSPV